MLVMRYIEKDRIIWEEVNLQGLVRVMETRSVENPDILMATAIKEYSDSQAEIRGEMI